jgi:hypothetical protein
MSAMSTEERMESREQDERNEQAAKRRKAFVVYATMDGEVKVTLDAESYLGTMSPFFDPASLARSGPDRFVCAPTGFIVRCIALVTSFVEWQQLDEGKLKREYQARVAAMVRALTACPFDQTHALRLGMTERLGDMEATLADGSTGSTGPTGYGAVGAAGADGSMGLRLTVEEASRLVGVTFPKTSGPGETRARAILCAFFAVKNRVVVSDGTTATSSKSKFGSIALCLRHFEIRNEDRVYEDIDGDPVIVVRGQDSPYGSSVCGIELIHGLASSVVIDLAEIRRGAQDERRRVAYKDTATVLGIMRIQKSTLQNRLQNRTDPALALLVEFLDAVALELASV